MSDDNKDFDGIKYRADTGSPVVFKLLLTVLVIWGICFMGYYLFTGWSSEGEFAAKKQAKLEQAGTVQAKGDSAPPPVSAKEGASGDNPALGKKEFAERCASCHGAEGKGGIGPDLTRKDYKYGKSEAAVTQTITDGRPGGMPPFKSDLSRDKIDGLVKFILSLK